MISLLLTSMARPSGFRVTLSFLSVLRFAVAIGQVAGALTLVLFLLCVIVRFLVTSTPRLSTTPEDAVPVLGGYPLSGLDEQSSFSAVLCAICIHVAFKWFMPLHSKDGCFHWLSLVSPLRPAWLGWPYWKLRLLPAELSILSKHASCPTNDKV